MASIGISDYSGSDWQNDNQVDGRFASPHVRTIRYSYAVLQEIRANALASFISIPRGGVEIGGCCSARLTQAWYRYVRTSRFQSNI